MTSYERDRRSTRIFIRKRIVVSGRNRSGRRFRDTCETIIINAHGSLIYTDQPLAIGDLLAITNPFTQEEQEARVVFLGDDSDKGRRVGFEFLTPAPHFWGVEFAQPDWPVNVAHPAVTQL
jgi:hypothetical protein